MTLENEVWETALSPLDLNKSINQGKSLPALGISKKLLILDNSERLMPD